MGKISFQTPLSMVLSVSTLWCSFARRLINFNRLDLRIPGSLNQFNKSRNQVKFKLEGAGAAAAAEAAAAAAAAAAAEAAAEAAGKSR